MEFRKMVTITLYARQQKRHRCIEQSFGPCGRRWEWDDLREQHWNMYITKCKIDDQCKFDAWSRISKDSALVQPRGITAQETYGTKITWTRKLWYIYTMEYYSAIKKNTFESVLMRWMKLEPIIQSEVSQKAIKFLSERGFLFRG